MKKDGLIISGVVGGLLTLTTVIIVLKKKGVTFHRPFKH